MKYKYIGIRPSDVARVMSVHMIAERSDVDDSLQRSHPITVGYGCGRFCEIMFSNHL